MKQLARWWWVTLLRWRGWPDPEATLDWLESRKSVMPPTERDR